MNTQYLNDSTERLHLEVDGDMRVKSAVIETHQHIPDSFLQDLANQRDFQDGLFAPDEIKLCSLPAALVDSWYRQGFSIWDANVTAADIVARLKAEDLHKFLATNRTI